MSWPHLSLQDDEYRLFVCNNNWYLFLRLHQLLCHRLYTLYKHSLELALQEEQENSSRNHNTALMLRLKPKSEYLSLSFDFFFFFFFFFLSFFIFQEIPALIWIIWVYQVCRDGHRSWVSLDYIASTCLKLKRSEVAVYIYLFMVSWECSDNTLVSI